MQNDFIKARETAHEIDDFIKNHQRSTEEYEAVFICLLNCLITEKKILK